MALSLSKYFFTIKFGLGLHLAIFYLPKTGIGIPITKVVIFIDFYLLYNYSQMFKMFC